MHSHPILHRRADIRAHLDAAGRLDVLRDSVIDLDIMVDDARRALDAAIDDYRAAVRERDEALRRLVAALDAREVA